MDTIIRIIQVIFALSILIVVHEFGHYLFARLFKIRVEKFYLFFPPSIFKYKPKNSDTEWGIGSIPLGGFCKISGMIDESMDEGQMKKEPQPWEFRTKPAWQRFFVLLGGVLFNFIFAILLFSAILYTWGDQYLKNENAKYGIEVNELSHEIGFRDGDKIISFDGIKINNFNELWSTLARNQAKTALVLRGNDTININIDPIYMPAIMNNSGMFQVLAPIAVGKIPEGSINEKAGIKQGDRFLRVAEKEVFSFNDLKIALAQYKNQTPEVHFLREGEEISIPLKCDSTGKIFVGLQKDISDFNVTGKSYSIIESIPAGFNRAINTVVNYIKELGLVFNPKTGAYKSVGSFISIGSIFPGIWNWQIMWNIMAWLSIMLAVLNLLPIPGLDGGHLLFTIYEIITRRKPSTKFLITAQLIGMGILLFIFIFAFGNDIFRLLN